MDRSSHDCAGLYRLVARRLRSTDPRRALLTTLARSAECHAQHCYSLLHRLGYASAQWNATAAYRLRAWLILHISPRLAMRWMVAVDARRERQLLKVVALILAHPGVSHLGSRLFS